MAAAAALQRRRIRRVHHRNAHGCEVLRIPRQDREAGIAGGCRDQNIGEPGGGACPARLVREPAREARRIGCQRQNAVSIKMQHTFEPCRQPFGLPRGALPAGLRDAAFDLGDGSTDRYKLADCASSHARTLSFPCAAAGDNAEMTLVLTRYTAATARHRGSAWRRAPADRFRRAALT